MKPILESTNDLIEESNILTALGRSDFYKRLKNNAKDTYVVSSKMGMYFSLSLSSIMAITGGAAKLAAIIGISVTGISAMLTLSVYAGLFIMLLVMNTMTKEDVRIIYNFDKLLNEIAKELSITKSLSLSDLQKRTVKNFEEYNSKYCNKFKEEFDNLDKSDKDAKAIAFNNFKECSYNGYLTILLTNLAKIIRSYKTYLISYENYTKEEINKISTLDGLFSLEIENQKIRKRGLEIPDRYSLILRTFYKHDTAKRKYWQGKINDIVRTN